MSLSVMNQQYQCDHEQYTYNFSLGTGSVVPVRTETMGVNFLSQCWISSINVNRKQGSGTSQLVPKQKYQGEQEQWSGASQLVLDQ